MKWWNRFGTSLLFALTVAGIYPIYAGFADLMFGRTLAFAAYVLTSAAIYLVGISRNPTLGLGAAFATIASGTLLLLAGATGAQLVLLTALLIGVFRSGLLQSAEGSFGRRFAREVVFIGGGLALAAYLSKGALFSEAFGFWGFYLAQSGFFLLGGLAARDRNRLPSNPGLDPFAAAVKRARELLAESGG